MKKLIMIAIVLVIVGQASALNYPDDDPPWRWCPGPYTIPNTGVVFWEFLDDGCMPTSDEYDPPYFYEPELGAPTFGSRHWDDPYDDSGWGCSYGGDCWVWSDGVFTVLAEDSFNQSIPERGEKQYLTQYFQVVHTMPPGITEEDWVWPIGLAIEIWDMSVYQESGWTGCPVGYETLPGDGYLNGYDCPSPDQHYELGDGWYKSVWMSKFSTDGSYYSGEYEEKFPELYDATHTVCIVGMELAEAPFQIEEVVVDFVWHGTPQIPECPPPWWPPDQIIFDPNIMGVYEEGETTGDFAIHLLWPPDEGADVLITVDPDRDSNSPHEDFVLLGSTALDGNITLVFDANNYDVPQTVVFKAIDDIKPEGTYHYPLTFTTKSADPNFDGFIWSRGIVVYDNDFPEVLLSTNEIVVSETGETSESLAITLSHQPEAEVNITLVAEGWAVEEGMFEITPPLGEGDDPDHITFTTITDEVWDPCTMTSGWNVAQTITVTAVDNDELAEAGAEYIPAEITLTPQSNDEWYNWTGFGGELEAEVVGVEVQDNECGAWGYMHVDVNKDCYIDLEDVALLYTQWLYCTEPYDAGYNQWGDCDALWNLLEEE